MPEAVRRRRVATAARLRAAAGERPAATGGAGAARATLRRLGQTRQGGGVAEEVGGSSEGSRGEAGTMRTSPYPSHPEATSDTMEGELFSRRAYP